MAPSAGPVCVQKEPGCAKTPALIGTRPGGSASAGRLSVGLISEYLPAVFFRGRAKAPRGGAE